jgi:hypothetical protein
MAPGTTRSGGGGYNVHTGMGDNDGSLSISGIEDLETISAANGQVSFGGGSLVDVDVLASRQVNTGALVATISVDTAWLTADSLISPIARIATATMENITSAAGRIATLTSDVATIIDLTVTNLNMVLLRAQNFVVEQVAQILTLNVTGDATVTGSLTAGNIIHEVNNMVYADADGLWTWQHAPLKEPVVYVVTALNNRNLDTRVKLDQQTDRSVRCYLYVDLAIGRSIDTDRNELHLLAIGS